MMTIQERAEAITEALRQMETLFAKLAAQIGKLVDLIDMGHHED